MSKKLSTRVRAGSEAAPWVVEAIRALERDRDIWQAKHGEAEQMTLSYVKRLHEMQAERDAARAAIRERPEWQPNGDCEVGWDPGPVCGWCHRFTFQGHRDDCARQAGLGIGGRR